MTRMATALTFASIAAVMRGFQTLQRGHCAHAKLINLRCSTLKAQPSRQPLECP